MKIKPSLSNLRRTLASAVRNLDDTRRDVAELRVTIDELAALVQDRIGEDGALPRELKRAMDALQVLYDEEPENRRRLNAARQSPEYELAYTESEPLVSVVIPTYMSFETLRDRAIPSLLEQTYSHWEAVVIGDAAPPETAAVLDAFRDTRIRYENLPVRGPYPEDEYDAWLVTAVPPFNAGLRAAHGRWIAPFADDDALRPTALERLLGRAREKRVEWCYGKFLLHSRTGKDEIIGAFPLRLAPDGITASTLGSILHSHLRFFEQELADAIFRIPNDWSMIRRMMRAGVRIGFLDEIVCDYYPSYRGEDAPTGSPRR